MTGGTVTGGAAAADGVAAIRGAAAIGGGATGGQVDRVFAALADPTRRQLLALLGGQEPASATALAGQLPVTRQAVVKHLAVLEDSELVSRKRLGRQIVFTVRPEPLVATASWMTTLASSWQERLELLKRVAEAQPGPGLGSRSGPG